MELKDFVHEISNNIGQLDVWLVDKATFEKFSGSITENELCDKNNYFTLDILSKIINDVFMNKMDRFTSYQFTKTINGYVLEITIDLNLFSEKFTIMLTKNNEEVKTTELLKIIRDLRNKISLVDCNNYYFHKMTRPIFIPTIKTLVLTHVFYYSKYRLELKLIDDKENASIIHVRDGEMLIMVTDNFYAVETFIINNKEGNMRITTDKFNFPKLKTLTYNGPETHICTKGLDKFNELIKVTIL